MVSNYLDDDTESTGVAKGSELADCVWEYLTYVPESDNYSLVGYEIYSGVSSYITNYLSEISDAPYGEYFCFLGLCDYNDKYITVRLHEDDVIKGYLNKFMPLPSPASSLDGTAKFLFVDTGLSYIYNVTLSDLVSYIKSH